MKKITAIICSLLMTCALVTGCGSSDDSSASKADSSVSSTADSSSTEGGALTKAYSEKVSGNHFSLDMTLTSNFTGEMPMVLEVADKDIYLKMSMMGMEMEIYMVDSTMYMLDSTTKVYTKEAVDPSELDMDSLGGKTFALDDSYKFVSSEETADGYICETFTADMSELGVDSGLVSGSDDYLSEYKYYFDKETKDLEKIEVNTMGMAETVTINSFSDKVEEIKLPDLSGWTEQSYEDLVADSSADIAAQ